MGTSKAFGDAKERERGGVSLWPDSQIIRERSEVATKKRRRPSRRAPSRLKVKLESEQNREPRVERIHEALVLESWAGNRVLEIGVRQTETLVTELIDSGLPGGINDVKHVKCKLELHPLA